LLERQLRHVLREQESEREKQVAVTDGMKRMLHAAHEASSSQEDEDEDKCEGEDAGHHRENSTEDAVVVDSGGSNAGPIDTTDANLAASAPTSAPTVAADESPRRVARRNLVRELQVTQVVRA